MKEDIENTSNSSKETRNVFIGAKVTPTQKEYINPDVYKRQLISCIVFCQNPRQLVFVKYMGCLLYTSL